MAKGNMLLGMGIIALGGLLAYRAGLIFPYKGLDKMPQLGPSSKAGGVGGAGGQSSNDAVSWVQRTLENPLCNERELFAFNLLVNRGMAANEQLTRYKQLCSGQGREGDLPDVIVVNGNGDGDGNGDGGFIPNPNLDQAERCAELLRIVDRWIAGQVSDAELAQASSDPRYADCPGVR